MLCQAFLVFKNSEFDAIAYSPRVLPLKMSLTRKQKYGKTQKCLFRRNYALTRRFDSYTFTKKAGLHLEVTGAMKNGQANFLTG